MREAYNTLKMRLRLGSDPRLVLTTTPKMACGLLREIAEQESTVITHGSTFDNAANLPASYLEDMRRQYGGTTLGLQELEGEFLDQAEGALWHHEWIEKHRVVATPKLVEIAVGVDPSASDREDHDECGIVAVGLGVDGHAYLLEDASIKASPDVWARRVVQCCEDNEADYVVEETTRGGALASTVIKLIDPGIRIRNRGAGRSKVTRAEPIAALSEQGRLHHVGPPERFEKLEEELKTFTPDMRVSPNRMDALVWAASEVMLRARPPKQRGLNEEGQSTRRKVSFS
jgi:predicted phage terminase large subunit-like protein